MCKKSSILFLTTIVLFCVLACHADVPQRQCTAVLSLSRGDNKSIQSSYSSALIFEYQIVLFGRQSQENGWTSFNSDSVQIDGIDEGVYNFYVRGRSGEDVYYIGMKKVSVSADATNYIVVSLNLCDDKNGNGNIRINGKFDLTGYEVKITYGSNSQTIQNVNKSFSFEKSLACGSYIFDVSIIKNNIVLGGDSFPIYIPAFGDVVVDVKCALNSLPTGTVYNIGQTHNLNLSKGDVVTFYSVGNNACTWTVGGKVMKTTDNYFEYRADSACKNLSVSCQNGTVNSSCSINVSKQVSINFFDLSYRHKNGFCCVGYEDQDGNSVTFPYNTTVYSENPSASEMGLYPIEKAVSSIASFSKIHYMELWLSDFDLNSVDYLVFEFSNTDLTPEHVVTHGQLVDSFLAGMVNLQSVYVKDSTTIGLNQFMLDSNLTKLYVSSTVNFFNKGIFSDLTQNITIYLEHPVGTDISNWGNPPGSWKNDYSGTYNVVYLNQ